jgi:hypothetical protein
MVRPRGFVGDRETDSIERATVHAAATQQHGVTSRAPSRQALFNVCSKSLALP